ncbi:hypothetical protein CK203_089351 [Vitis vinifera]|uniref:Transducin/WD40 repeat-like superfamily protein n=1 Tax=Vitis vinifera TaxID=29760 RepID=A0A438D2V9_VITVI|nr:hypothetical protein CK203_089351 [Vitis vinifera]
MEGRRISAIPRPCAGRRVSASKKRPRVDGFLNSVKKLQRREISSRRDRGFSISNAQERFRNMRQSSSGHDGRMWANGLNAADSDMPYKVGTFHGHPWVVDRPTTINTEKFKVSSVEEYDTHDPKGPYSPVLPFKRTKVIEIVAARDIVFALAHSGVCAAFSRDNAGITQSLLAILNAETNERICFLNVSPDEVIRSLFYNKNNDSLITVSVYASDSFSSLKCRSTRIEYIRRGKPEEGFALFESESLKWPGFVEFDDVNGKVLTYSAQDSIYKVFDLKNYVMLYSISDENVQEIKIRCLIYTGLNARLYSEKLENRPKVVNEYFLCWKGKKWSYQQDESGIILSYCSPT